MCDNVDQSLSRPLKLLGRRVPQESVCACIAQEGGRFAVGSMSSEAPDRQESVVGSTWRNTGDPCEGISLPETLVEGLATPWKGVFPAWDFY